MNLDANEVAAILRSYPDDNQDEAFLSGIQYALKCDFMEWEQFMFDVQEELNRLHEASWGREYEKRIR